MGITKINAEGAVEICIIRSILKGASFKLLVDLKQVS